MANTQPQTINSMYAYKNYCFLIFFFYSVVYTTHAFYQKRKLILSNLEQ